MDNIKKYLLGPKNKVFFYIVAVIILLGVPNFVSGAYSLQIFILVFMYAAASGSWNIIGGYGGQISLGHSAYFGIGAYITTLLYVNLGVTPWLGMIVGAVIAAIVACLISYPCFRLRGPFFTLASLAFAEVLRLLCIWARPVTGGQVGITILYEPGFSNMQFPGKAPYYYMVLGLFVIVFMITKKIENSKFGFYLTALKEDHDAAEALGVNTARYKLYATGISGFLTALCGAFFAQLLLYIEPAAVFSMDLSIHFAMMAVVGGAGTVWGPLVGSAILTPLNELLRGALGGSYQGLNFVIFGLILILVVTYMPNGIVGFFRDVKKKIYSRYEK